MDERSNVEVPEAGEARSRRDRGHLMAGLMAAIAILMIFSTLTFQGWVDLMRRANEAEMIFRGEEYARAILRYQLANGGQGPLELEKLLEPAPNTGSYLMRQLYEDPLVPDGKWGLLYQGQNNQIIDPNALQEPQQAGGLGSGSPSLLNPPTTGNSGNNATGTPGAPTPFGLQGSAAAGGQVTGLPIAGVRSLCEDRPFRVYNGFTEYREWLFTYLRAQELLAGKLPGTTSGQTGAGGAPGGVGGVGNTGAGGFGGRPGTGAAGGRPRGSGNPNSNRANRGANRNRPRTP